MIRSIRLINWKSFTDATLHIDPLTVIIGMNASGKSNILDALIFLQRIASGVSVTAALSGDNNLSALRGGLEWCAMRPEKRFTIEAIISPEESRAEYNYSISVAINGISARVCSENLKRIDTDKALFYTQESISGPVLPAYFSTGKKGSPRRIDQNPFYTILSQTETMTIAKIVKESSRYVREQLQSIFILDPIPSHMRDYSPLSDALKSDASNMSGVLASLPDKGRNEVESTLTGYLQSLPERDIQKVWTERVGKFESDAMLYCEEQWVEGNSQTVDARGMSDGTLRFLAIVTALLTSKEGSLLVVEEVDNGLHPSRSSTLVNMLRELGNKRSIDVIVTTHNPALLNALGPEMVPFISVVHRDSIGASAITLLEDIENLPKLMAIGPLGRVVSEGRIEDALNENVG